MSAAFENAEMLPGRLKAAVLLASLGPEIAGRIIGALGAKEVERVAVDLSRLGSVDAQLKARILDEFHALAREKRHGAHGGAQAAREAVGKTRAEELMERLDTEADDAPFRFAHAADAAALSAALYDEHPQTIALVLAHLAPATAALALAALPLETQAQAVLRIATMEGASAEIVREVEEALKEKMGGAHFRDYVHRGGAREAAVILNELEAATEKNLLSELRTLDGDVASAVSERMFLFEDIARMRDDEVKKILRELDVRNLAAALKGADRGVILKFLANMPERAQHVMKEELSFMSASGADAQCDAQRKIVAIVKRLKESGQLKAASRAGARE